MSLSCFSLCKIYFFCLTEQLCNNEVILAAFSFMLDICISSWRLNEKVRIGLYLPPPLQLTYLLTTRRVPGYPLSYPVGYPGNELPDNGSMMQKRSLQIQLQNLTHSSPYLFNIWSEQHLTHNSKKFMKTQNSNDGRRLRFGVYTDLVHFNI